MRTEARGVPVNNTTASDSAPATSSASAPRVVGAFRVLPRYALFLFLAIAGLIWDLWSKWAVFNELGSTGQRHIWKGSFAGLTVQFDLATTFNRGALWGIGQNQTWIFATLSVLAITVILYFLWTRQAIASWWLTVTTGLLLAGTLGNLYDRLGLHHWKDDNGPVYAVRDFLDFIFNEGAFHWATFNFADVYLVTGAIMLVLHSFWTPTETSTAAKV